MKKKLTWAGILVVLGMAIYHIYTLYWSPDNSLRQIYLVPRDAMYILETNDPLRNWEKFQRSKPWQYLQAQEKMKEISDNAYALDSVLHENKTLLGMLGKRNLMISAHMTRRSDYDFLFVVDMQKTAKMESLKDQVENLMKMADYKVTSRNFKGYKILELFDNQKRTTLYMAFVSNHLVCSYTGILVEKSISEKENPTIGRDLYFLDIEQQMSNSGLCRIYINYGHFNQYLTMLAGLQDENMMEVCNSMKFSGLQFDTSHDKMSIKGYTNLNDSTDSYLLALMQSGKNNITAQKILSHRTAFFLTMGFDNANLFMDNLEQVMKNTPESYQTFKKNQERIEGLLGISIRDHFLSWMDGEVVFAQNTPGMLGRQNEFVAVIKMKDKEDAIKNLQFIEKRISAKTPVKFKQIDYEGYEIHYLEIKGFFRLLFGRMFEKLNKPYYTIIDDYVVFSNSTATLLSMIEDYRSGQTLNKDKEFKEFMGDFNSKASIFAYTNTQKFFPLWKEFVSASTWEDLQANSNYVLCFPQTAFQLTGGKQNMFDTRLIAQFSEPKEEEEEEETEEEMIQEELDFSSREDTLKNLQLFYVEKMSSNVYTEFYEDGTIKSRTEIKKGIRHGKHQAFHPNGKMKANGKFKNNKRNGTWRHYDENERLILKEKWKDGVLK